MIFSIINNRLDNNNKKAWKFFFKSLNYVIYGISLLIVINYIKNSYQYCIIDIKTLNKTH